MARREGNPAMNRRPLLALAGGLFLFSGLAQAQTTAPAGQRLRLRGRIDSVSADRIELTLRDGSKASVALAADLRVNEMTPLKLSDIQEGSYIGTAAVAQPDGVLRAIEVTVFPPAARGVAEGHFPWDLHDNSTMTNGTVGSMTNGTVGRVGAGEDMVMTVRYKDGEQRVLVPEEAPVVTFGPGTRALLVPGGQVVVNATRAADGSLTAAAVTIGKDGLVPPN
jgi:hypothetical protein